MSSLLNAATPPQAGAAEQSRTELQVKLNGLGGLSGRKLDPETKAKKLREACEGFESIFIQKMWQEMRNTVPKSGLLSGREEKFWQDMYDQELAKSMTKAGGIGLADMMFEQLSRNLANASSQAAGGSVTQAFVPTAAPLVNPVSESAYKDNAAAAAITPASIYDGAAPSVAVDAEAETAVTPAPEAPLVAPALAQRTPRPQNLTHADTKTHQPGSKGSTLGGINGVQQAYLAQRDAGDKLGSGAVRPALRANNKTRTASKAVEEVTQPETYAPGSAQSLAQALELAKNGAGIQSSAQPASYANLVNEARARNALRDTLTAKAAETMTANNLEAASKPEKPIVRKTRYTTNVPRPATSKKGDEAIRLLNVDNVGVNSKQGQGLAQWHKAQAAQAEAAQMQAATHPGGQSFSAPQPAEPISPLTANALNEQQEQGTYAIPPLKPGDIRS